MKRIWVKKSNSFKSASQLDTNYYLSMSPSKRLETMQFLREIVSQAILTVLRARQYQLRGEYTISATSMTH